MNKGSIFAKLPSVDKVLSNYKIEGLLNNYPRQLVIESIREVIELKRQEIINLDEDNLNLFNIEEEILINDIIHSTKSKFQLSIKRVINGTGIVIHTNLGRSKLSPKVQEELIQIGFGYSNLEYNL